MNRSEGGFFSLLFVNWLCVWCTYIWMLFISRVSLLPAMLLLLVHENRKREKKKYITIAPCANELKILYMFAVYRSFMWRSVYMGKMLFSASFCFSCPPPISCCVDFNGIRKSFLRFILSLSCCRRRLLLLRFSIFLYQHYARENNNNK